MLPHDSPRNWKQNVENIEHYTRIGHSVSNRTAERQEALLKQTLELQKEIRTGVYEVAACTKEIAEIMGKWDLAAQYNHHKQGEIKR